MSPKLKYPELKCHQNLNITKTHMSPKLKYHLKWNVTKTKISLKLKYHPNSNVTKITRFDLYTTEFVNNKKRRSAQIALALFRNRTGKLNFLKYILHQKKESLVHKFFKAQCENPIKGYWVSSIRKIMNEITLNMTFEEIMMKKRTI